MSKPITLEAPAAVCGIAQAIRIGTRDVATRLVRDPRMQPVWKSLKQRAQEMHDKGELEVRLTALPERYLLHTYGLSDRLAVLPFEEQRARRWKFSERYASLPDHACAAFCACALTTLGVNKIISPDVGNRAVTRADIEAQTNEYRRLAASLRRAHASDPFFAPLSPEVSGYSAVIADLEERANSIETAARSNRSHYLERSSGKRGPADDNVRAQARAIACGAQEIFAEFRYRTVATVVSVALRLDVNGKDVRNWCVGLPPANKPLP